MRLAQRASGRNLDRARGVVIQRRPIANALAGGVDKGTLAGMLSAEVGVQVELRRRMRFQPGEQVPRPYRFDGAVRGERHVRHLPRSVSPDP